MKSAVSLEYRAHIRILIHYKRYSNTTFHVTSTLEKIATISGKLSKQATEDPPNSGRESELFKIPSGNLRWQ